MANNPPTTILEALLFLWRRGAEGKDRRRLTDDQRCKLDAEDPDGTNQHHSFDGVRILRDADGTPFVRWREFSHAMTWPLFRGWEAGIECFVSAYALPEYPGHLMPDAELQRARQFLKTLVPDLDLFRQYVLDGFPSLADEWPAPTDKQPPAPHEIVIKLDVQQSAQAKQVKSIEQPGGGSATQQVDVKSRLTAQDWTKREQLVSTYIRKRREKGVPIERISRDGIARASGVPSTAVSGTRAWVAFAAEKRQAKAKPPLRGPSTTKDDDLLRGKAGENIDAAIDREDWEAVKAAQKRMQRSKR